MKYFGILIIVGMQAVTAFCGEFEARLLLPPLSSQDGTVFGQNRFDERLYSIKGYGQSALPEYNVGWRYTGLSGKIEEDSLPLTRHIDLVLFDGNDQCGDAPFDKGFLLSTWLNGKFSMGAGLMFFWNRYVANQSLVAMGRQPVRFAGNYACGFQTEYRFTSQFSLSVIASVPSSEEITVDARYIF